MSQLGFIGLGIMGHGMAANLLRAGHDLNVWNRTPAKADDLKATLASSPRALGEISDVVFVCVSDSADVEEVAFGPEGVIDGMKPGTILVDHSTISPSVTRDLAARAAQRGVTWIDAPVSGGSEGAVNGTLAVMVGGPSDALSRVREYMDSYAATVVHVGEPAGSGQTAKLVNQILVVVNQLAVSEALLLASGAGLDLNLAIKAVSGGAAGSWMLSNRGPQMIEGNWEPGFTIDLQQKDLRLVLDAADELGVPLPGTALIFQMYRSLQKAGLGQDGNHALIKALERMSGLRLTNQNSTK